MAGRHGTLNAWSQLKMTQKIAPPAQKLPENLTQSPQIVAC